MLIINNNDDTPITIKTYSEVDPLKIFYYLKFTDSSNSNTKILEVINQSTQPKYYNRFLILENSDIPAGRGVMEFYASTQAGLSELDTGDLINSQDYELERVDTFEIVQYEPALIEFIYYNQPLPIPVLNPPNEDLITRRLSVLQNNVWVDSVAGRDSEIKGFPVSNIGVADTIVLPDLSGVSIVSYSGNQILYIFENSIISSGIGSVWDIVLSNDTIIPLPHLKIGIDNNGDRIDLIVSSGVIGDLNTNGSDYLVKYGCVKEDINITPESHWLDLNNWNLDSSVILDVNSKFIEITNDANMFNNAKLNITLNTNTKYTFTIEVLENTLTGTGNALIRNNGFIDNFLTINAGQTGVIAHEATTLSTIINPFIWSFLATSGVNNEILKYRIISVKLATPGIIPNNLQGEPLEPIVEGSTFVAGTNGEKLNTSPMALELYPAFQIDEEYTFFDTSNILIWKNAFDWNTIDLSQQFINDNIQDNYKDRLFIKVVNGIIEDFMLYPEALNEEQLIQMNDYLNN